MKPRVLVLADVPGWAWARKADAYARHLTDFDITVAYHSHIPTLDSFDLVHLFEVSQTGILPDGPRSYRAVAGLTANVWRTWGAEQMHAWAGKVDALHANSLLLQAELKPFHARVYYTPNGVDPETFRRQYRDLQAHLVFGHVGKPNPRKGGDLIITAAQQAGVELRTVRRSSKLALSQAEMVAWYQGIDVMVTASNMDGTPNPMLEGAACEAALLSTPIGNMPQFIQDGYNGWLTKAELPYPWSHSVGEQPSLLGMKHLQDELTGRMRWFARHPVRTLEMGRAARGTVEAAWTWKQQVRYVATMWHEVLR